MQASHASIALEVPPWIDETTAAFPAGLDSDDARMRLAIALARQNVERGGGPFGAAVFLGSKLVGAGVNLVMATGLSIAHAEIVAMLRAQLALRGEPHSDAERYSLVASTEPCCQCFGAIVWSGVDQLVCGATTADAEGIGFDEGPKPALWVDELEARGIAVSRSIRRDEARAVLEEYARRGGPIYGRSARTRKRT